MTSATDELRRMLDERGVPWKDYGYENHTWWGEWHAENRPSVNGLFLKVEGVVTPEQAIAATLGNEGAGRSNDGVAKLGVGTCRNISKVMDEHGQARFACSECGAWIDSRMLWNPEYRNGESPWVSGCKLNFCPNCGARVVDDG